MTTKEIDELWWQLDHDLAEYCTRHQDFLSHWFYWERKFAILWCAWKLS